MDHVEIDHLSTFIDDLKVTLHAKKELRAKYKGLRKTLTYNDIEEMSLTIANAVVKLPIWEKIIFMFFYLYQN